MTVLQGSSDKGNVKIFVDFDLSPSYTPLLIFRNLKDDSTSTINLEYGNSLVWKTGERTSKPDYDRRNQRNSQESNGNSANSQRDSFPLRVVRQGCRDIPDCRDILLRVLASTDSSKRRDSFLAEVYVVRASNDKSN